MNPSQSQIEYINKRRFLMRAWSYAGPLLLLGIIGFVIYLKVNTPVLIDPFEVISSIENGSIEQSLLLLMAALLPIMSILVFILLIVLVVLMYAAFSIEKKYLAIIDNVTGGNFHDSQ